MKEKDISRDIGGRIRRSAGDAPSLGQVTRMTTMATPETGGRRRRRVTDDGERSQKKRDKENERAKVVTFRWTLLAGGMGFVIVAAFFGSWLRQHLDLRARMAEENRSPGRYMVVDEIESPTAIDQEDAIALAKRAVRARDPKEVLKTIRCGQSNPDEVIAYLKALKDVDGEVSGYDWLERLDTTRPDIQGVVVNFQKEGLQRNRLALLVACPDGQWRMDFPALSRQATPAWNELIEGRAPSALVRVYAASDQYFNGMFKEIDGWRCYGLASPDVPELMFGYCKSDSAQGRAMLSLLMSGEQMARVTLQLDRVEGAEKRQYLIKRVFAADWALGTAPFDGE